jgi:HSP20 family protein
MDEREIPIEIRLREFRKRNNLSQEELADELGISRQSIITLEQGKSMPSLPLAVSLCRFFNAQFEDIFEFENELQNHIATVREFHSPISIKIMNLPSLGSGEDRAMADLEPWRPFHRTVSLRDAMDCLFEESVITPEKAILVMPKIDVKDAKGAIVVKAELPGVKEEDINVEILDGVMTISGEKKDEIEEKDESKGYYYKESHTGAFSRSFSLPSDISADEASAEMANGVLTITMPKVEPKKAQKVTVIVKK